jgi:hypothetical protein
VAARCPRRRSRQHAKRGTFSRVSEQSGSESHGHRMAVPKSYDRKRQS